MYAHHSVFDEGGEGEVVEDLGTVAPHIHTTELLQTLQLSKGKETGSGQLPDSTALRRAVLG